MVGCQDGSDGGSDKELGEGDGAEPLDIESLKEIDKVSEKKKLSKLDRLFARKNNDVLSSAFDKIRAHDTKNGGVDRDSDSDDFLTKKRPRQGLVAEEDGFLTKKKPRQSVDADDVEAKPMKAKRCVHGLVLYAI